MTAAVVYAFAVAPEVAAQPNAAPPAVLARQLPRLAVNLLNGEGDRGLRFFPFLGRQRGARRFIEPADMLAVSSLLTLHGQRPSPNLLVDGRIEPARLRLRIVEGEGGSVRFEDAVPFDPNEPLPAVQRLMFELASALGWRGAPPKVLPLAGAALRSYLLARDDLLRLEAGILVPDERRTLAAALRPLWRAPLESDTRELLVQVSARLAARGRGVERIGPAVVRVSRRVLRCKDPGVAAFAARAAAVLHGCGLEEAAAMLREAAVARSPDQVEAATRAAAHHFERGDLERARAVLQRVREAGHADAAVLAQLVLIEDQAGRAEARLQSARELAALADVPPAMARVAASCLADEGEVEAALALVRRVRAGHPDDPELWLDEGRVLLAASRGEEAAAAFEQCLARAPREPVAREARRSRDLAAIGGAVADLREIEAALGRGELPAALRLARRLVRRGAHLPEAWLALGVVRQRLGHDRRARRALARAVTLRPDLGDAHDRLGILWVRARRPHRGLEHLHEAVRLLPGDAGPRIHLAQALALVGRRDEGLAALEEAERLGGDAETVAAVRTTFFEAG